MKVISILLLFVGIIAFVSSNHDTKRQFGGGGGQTRVIQLGSIDELMKLISSGALENLINEAGGGGGGGGGNPFGGNPFGGNSPVSQFGNQFGGGNPFGNGGYGNQLGNELGFENPLGGNLGGGGGGGGGDFRQAALEETNKLRARHGAAPLVLDEQLNRESQAYAEKLAQMNKMQHSCSNCGYGENLYMMGGAILDPAVTARNAVNSWYDEVKKYDWSNPRFVSGTGHFTALVWKGSRKMGFGVASNQATRSTYVVARYVPAGNLQGAFAENVGRAGR